MSIKVSSPVLVPDSDTHILEFSHGSVTLNEEQYKVVTSPLSENQRILASAGSGKTTTITARIAYLVENYDIQPNKILLMTFSRAAAQEMIHRVRQLIGPVQMYAGTFHALSAQILREMCPRMLGDQPFIDELPYRLVKWLTESPTAKEWVKRFRTIIVDEFQDINDIQWQLLKAFHHQYATTTIVGDDAQNIYTWRGSSVDFILKFHESVPRLKDYQLCRNYRSSEAIVTTANCVMRFIPTLPFKEKMIANMRGGRKPEVHYFFRAADEYDWVVSSLEKMLKLYPKVNFAVLSRYNSDLFRIEERLHLKQVPYNLCTQFDPERSKAHEKRITLATIHASKGLEWDIVFFMNLHDDVFPSRKSDEEIVCERRLFYVGVTRAKYGLFMSWSRHERALSRFVREIPRPFLKFHNVASFKLSTNESTNQVMSLEDMIRGFDGADWNKLREENSVPQIKMTQMDSIYRFGELYGIPEWVKENDIRETWFELLHWISLRECAIHLNKLDELCTPNVREALLTLRVYKEDIEFWEMYEAEMELLIHTFLKHSYQMPAVEYHQLEDFVKGKLPHLDWSTQEMSHALMIIAKIRGQLRPLRHGGFDLNEFSFGCVRNSVPTELRPLVLQSWHKVLNKKEKSSEILADIWRIASISSVIEGRNIPLYQCDEIKEYFVTKEMLNITKAIENAIPKWIVSQENPALNFIFEADGMKPIQFDILTDKYAIYTYFDPIYVPSMEDKILLLLKQFAYEEVFDRSLEAIGFLNMATGVTTLFEVTGFMREQMSHMWQYLQQKYLGY